MAWQIKKNKYGAVKTIIDGLIFDSKAEAGYYAELKILKRGGAIKDFKRQIKYELVPAYTRNGKKQRARYYIADFVITENDGREIVVDVKGGNATKTDLYKFKKNLLLYLYPNIEFKEVEK